MDEIRPVVLFDGRCGFCTWSVQFARNTVQADVEFIPYQSVDVADFGLTDQQCEQAVQYVDSRGSVAGELAVASILRSGRGVWRPIGTVMACRPIRPVAGAVYRLVARHRGRLWGVAPPLT